MNLKKAKALRRLAKFVFTKEKAGGNENMKNIEADTLLWMENTNRKVFTEEQDYALVQAFDNDGLAIKNEDGTPKLVPAPKMDDEGKPVMRKVEWAPGTITVHPMCVRGIYHNLKKNAEGASLEDINRHLAFLQFQSQVEANQQASSAQAA